MLPPRSIDNVLEGAFEVDLLPDGSVRGPDRLVYRRTPERVKPKPGRELVDAGASVVTNVWPEGITWFAGEAARQQWAEIRPRLVLGRPPPLADLQWVGHVWESDSGVAMLWFDGTH